MSTEQRTIRVLVVDDQPMFHTLIQRILGREHDIEVVGGAASVEEGMEAVRSLLPDVVLMDHQLPDGRGTDAARQVLAHFRTVRIVMLTAAADDRTLNAARNAGCSGYITKDRAKHDLAPAVRAAYRGETVVPRDSVALFMEPDDEDDE